MRWAHYNVVFEAFQCMANSLLLYDRVFAGHREESVRVGSVPARLGLGPGDSARRLMAVPGEKEELMWHTARRAAIVAGAATALLAPVASTSMAATTPRRADPPASRAHRKADAPASRAHRKADPPAPGAHRKTAPRKTTPRKTDPRKVDPPTSRAVDLPLQGTFDGTGCNAPENIDVTGTVHVVVRADTKKGNVSGATSLSGTTGTGEFTGATYQFTNSDSFQGTIQSGQRARITFFPTFMITRPGAPPNPCGFVAETVDVGADGAITGITASTFSPGPEG